MIGKYILVVHDSFGIHPHRYHNFDKAFNVMISQFREQLHDSWKSIFDELLKEFEADEQRDQYLYTSDDKEIILTSSSVQFHCSDYDSYEAVIYNIENFDVEDDEV